jgi:transcriptional regulator with XRE-family HTH domain
MISSTMTPIADRIRRERHRASLTQAQLAEAAGLCQEAVSHWETGRRVPTVTNLDRLAAGIGIPTAQFFQDDADVMP